MLLDSNIIIYSTQPEHDAIRQLIREHSPAVSVVSYIEVMGFHGLEDEERISLQEFFDAAEMLPVSDPIVERAVTLRQQRRMSLGDSIVAATALVHKRTLVTHNTKDFQWVDELAILDPLDTQDAREEEDSESS